MTDRAPASWKTQMLSCSKGGYSHSWYKEITVVSFAKNKNQHTVQKKKKNMKGNKALEIRSRRYKRKQKWTKISDFVNAKLFIDL